MQKSPMYLLALLLILPLALAPASPALAGELAGVTLADSAEVGGKTLTLNGLGLRKKAIFKVYVAGLYLESEMSDPDAILAADAPRRVVMALVRKVSADQLCGGWEDGLEGNTPDASADLQAAFKTLCDYMDDVQAGDSLVFTYVPGTGTEVEVKGESKGTIEGKAFADALFSCWIGPKPPGEDFKEGLLGK